MWRVYNIFFKCDLFNFYVFFCEPMKGYLLFTGYVMFLVRTWSFTFLIFFCLKPLFLFLFFFVGILDHFSLIFLCQLKNVLWSSKCWWSDDGRERKRTKLADEQETTIYIPFLAVHYLVTYYS